MINTRTAISGLVFITLMNGFVSVNMFKQQGIFYSTEVDKVLMDNRKLHSEIISNG